MTQPQSDDDPANRDTLISISGLEFMQGVRDGRLPGPPIAKLMGFAVETVEPGKVAFLGRPSEAVLNPMGAVHGGWYGAILDSCMGCAVMTTVPKGSVYTTLEYKINIVRAAPLSTELRATGTVQHAGRRTAVAASELRGVEDGRLYATGSTTCIIMPAD